jgi:hypothetical protein
MPDFMVTHDPYGSAVTEVTGVARPVLLAHYATGLEKTGAASKALLIRAALVADGRCWRCGRRLRSRTSLSAGSGRDCRK